MPDTVTTLLDRAKQLTPAEQDELVDRLIDAGCPDSASWQAEWAAEAERRLDEYRRDPSTAIAAEDVLTEGRRRSAARRGAP